MSAGVEKVLSPELIESPIPLTNGRGVFGPALAEFSIAAMLYFAKDLRRLIRQQEAARWEQFDVAFLRDQTLGVVGYGGIGREVARLAHALGMKVMALRRRTPSSENDPVLERSFTREQLNEMLSLSDYVLAAAPLTPETQGMLGLRRVPLHEELRRVHQRGPRRGGRRASAHFRAQPGSPSRRRARRL